MVFNENCFSTTCLSIAGVYVLTLADTCKTFGSGVVKPFDGSHFYVSSDCPFTFARFTLNRVECDIAIRRGPRGLLAHVEIIINKIKTVLHGGDISVEGNSVSLPYDHTYQHIFRYGIYTRLRSSLLPLSVTWHVLPGGIDTLRVELEHELSAGVAGLCGKDNLAGVMNKLSPEEEAENNCFCFKLKHNACRHFFSYTLDCLRAKTPSFIQICEQNSHSFEESPYIRCAFFKEVAEHCGNTRFELIASHSALIYLTFLILTARCDFLGSPPRISPAPAVILTCIAGTVLNDHADSYQCVKVSSCPCEFAGRMYSTGDIRNTKCQSCVCHGGKWSCSENFCPPKCLIEGQYVTTFDGKQYVVPGKCTYMASESTDWMVTIVYSKKEASLKMVTLQLYQVQTVCKDHALVFWQSSMYVQVQTSFGMKLQVQVFPEVQVYITPPSNHTAMISGLCGNSNGDTTDDFTTSSGIVENSAQAFALSWSVGPCPVNIPPTCINTDNEIYADEKCSMLNNPAGIFAECHEHIPTDQYHTACIQRTCNCGSNLHQCLCVALSSYANACARLGVQVKDWRKATNCTLQCPKNMQFSYQTAACNRTCRSLSGPDPCCGLEDDPVEGCGCPEGTHLNQGQTCSPKAECVCHHHGGTTPPGPVVIDGCRNGKVCFHCSEYPVNTALKTCDSLSKPLGANVTCESGCYCPHGQFEDHRGNCVPRESCTCVFSGKIFSPGQQVKTNCKTCVCGAGQWRCEDEPCPGTCQVYGNGQYQTFDSKWYRFNGHCQYTLVEDYCGKTSGTFSVSVESVPCCDEALTCSRSIVLNLQDEVSLILSDMRVTKKVNKGWTLNPDSLYTIHTVGRHASLF
uniref:VWFD domain-containing protein n=1 Tax=Salarias fasciatus TaxID=181472 RepID=A0A672HPP5_SALFA